MSDSAACVFYGAEISRKSCISFVKSNIDILTKNPNEKDDILSSLECNADLVDCLEGISNEFGFDFELVSDCIDTNNDRFFVSVYSYTVYNYDVCEEIDMIDPDALSDAWEVVKKKLKTKKKPRLFLSSCIF